MPLSCNGCMKNCKRVPPRQSSLSRLANWAEGCPCFGEPSPQRTAQLPQQWGNCHQCGSRLESKGFVSRRMLTLVGWGEWRRRVGRCPNRCAGSHDAPFDKVLGIVPYQQTCIELVRLGCLLAVFLPFELAVQLLSQLCGIGLSDDTVWQWVQLLEPDSITSLSQGKPQKIDRHLSSAAQHRSIGLYLL